MRQLERALGKLLRGTSVRRPDTQRSAREKAKSLIERHEIELEKLRDGGFNVWGLRDLDDALDPYHGDHYASDWAEVLPMVEAYARIAAARQTWSCAARTTTVLDRSGRFKRPAGTVRRNTC